MKVFCPDSHLIYRPIEVLDLLKLTTVACGMKQKRTATCNSSYFVFSWQANACFLVSVLTNPMQSPGH